MSDETEQPIAKESPYAPNGFIPAEARWLIMLLRLVGRVLGYDPAAEAYDTLARELDLPASSYISRKCGSWALAKWLAEIGPEPAHGSGPLFSFKSRHLSINSPDDVLDGMALAWRVLDYRPSSESWDVEARRLRQRGYAVPYMGQIVRWLGSWSEAEARTRERARHSENALPSPPRRNPVTPAKQDEVAYRLLEIEDALGYRPKTTGWSDVSHQLASLGLPPLARSQVYKHFRGWGEAWAHVDALRRRGRGEAAA